MELIDVNCRIGAVPAPQEGAPYGAAEIEALMDRFRVTRALVYHAAARDSDVNEGNATLLAETAGNSRFLRQWAVMPPLWERYPQPDKWVRRMRENRVCAARLFPAKYGHSLRRYAVGALTDALAGAGIPVFIGMDQLRDWDALFDLCRENPAAKIVLCGPGYRCLRQLIPIMDACENLYVETSNFLTHNGLREFCRYQGADRLLFGSGAPETSLAAAASQLLLSDLKEADKQKIASGNARALLGEETL